MSRKPLVGIGCCGQHVPLRKGPVLLCGWRLMLGWGRWQETPAPAASRMPLRMHWRGWEAGAQCHLCTLCFVCKARKLLGLGQGEWGGECVSELDEQVLESDGGRQEDSVAGSHRGSWGSPEKMPWEA